MRSAKAEIGQVYHPYNLETGQKQDSETVSDLLADCFDRIHTATADLTDRCKKRVDKAQRVVGGMVATISFFFQMIEIYFENMQLSNRDKVLMYNYLIPGGCKSGVLEYWSIGVLGAKAEKDLISVLRSLLLRDQNRLDVCLSGFSITPSLHRSITPIR